ncbi:hypothetical protein SAMN02745866_00549 [Alteromonadaceae bacterium Bs31]|nr:hypothetical protein SAMN02745866_00549 [Alteromonadaceae bacterium Bs31]
MKAAVQGLLIVVSMFFSSVSTALSMYTLEWQGTVGFKGWGCETHQFSDQMCSFGEVGDVFAGEINFSLGAGDVNPSPDHGDYPIDWILDDWSWEVVNLSSSHSSPIAGNDYCMTAGECSVSTSNTPAQDELVVSEYYDYGNAGIELLVRDLSGSMLGGDGIPLGVMSLLNKNTGFSVWDELGGFSGVIDSLSISANGSVSAVPIPGTFWLLATFAPFFLVIRKKLACDRKRK